MAQPEWRQPRNPFAPLAGVSEDQLEGIHQASLTILEEIGSDRVRLDRGLIEGALGQAPESFTLHARNPERNLEIGGNAVAFAAMSSAPNCSDLEGGRRPGSHRDFRDLLKLGQSLNAVHLIAGYPVEPLDLHPSIRRSPRNSTPSSPGARKKAAPPPTFEGKEFSRESRAPCGRG